MNGNDRREKLLTILQESQTAVSGKTLAGRLEVSRQVIVQDIALLRANGNDIISTNLGYVLMSNKECRRVFKMQHSDDQVIEELKAVDINTLSPYEAMTFLYTLQKRLK